MRWMGFFFKTGAFGSVQASNCWTLIPKSLRPLCFFLTWKRDTRAQADFIRLKVVMCVFFHPDKYDISPASTGNACRCLLPVTVSGLYHWRKKHLLRSVFKLVNISSCIVDDCMTAIDFSSSLINAAWCHSANANHILRLSSITAPKSAA